jgi:lipopolysaccharide transport system ATP-binding protein
MALRFDHVRYAGSGPLIEIDWKVPAGIFVGLIGPNGCGAEDILRLAAGAVKPEEGSVENEGARLAEASLSSTDPDAVVRSIKELIDEAPAVLLVGPSLVLVDRARRAVILADFHRLQRAGTTVVVFTHDLELLERHADEIVALNSGKIVDQGDPGLVLGRYRERELQRTLELAEPHDDAPPEHHGDGRTILESVRITDAAGIDVAHLKSGAPATVELSLRASREVAGTVVGIMIRSRVGVTVYGTNTELEGVPLGRLAAGERIQLRFEFDCNLCPGEYTLTVASHEPDGTPHDWIEEAIFFSVEDARYTAGVANLRAKVTIVTVER